VRQRDNRGDSRAFFLLTIATIFLLAIPSIALAHDRGSSYSTWRIHDREASVEVRISELDVSRFPWAATGGPGKERTLGKYLTERLQLFAADTPCAVTDGPRKLETTPGHFLYEWRLTCPQAGALQIRSDLLEEVSPSHLHFARVTRDGSHPMERVLSERERSWPLATVQSGSTTAPAGTSLAGYFRLGVEHILSGYDHLAFLLALLLIGGSLGEVAKMVTGFTVAHSLTLGLMVLGYLRPALAPVEALIGLSIALVAAENLWLASARVRTLPWAVSGTLALLALAAAYGYGRVPGLTLAGLAVFTLCYFEVIERSLRVGSVRWAIAFIFGLVHGFGFASMLGQAGIPADRIAAALFGFNAGVEAGQLAVVGVVWPLLRVVTREHRPRLRVAVVEVGSAAVFALGVYWFVARAYG
jgi:hypothetical protein